MQVTFTSTKIIYKIPLDTCQNANETSGKLTLALKNEINSGIEGFSYSKRTQTGSFISADDLVEMAKNVISKVAETRKTIINVSAKKID